MVDEISEPAQQEAIQQEEAVPTEESRMTAAMNLLGQEELEKATAEVPIEEEQKQEEEIQTEPAQDRSDYFAKLTEKDKEIRQLKTQLKSLGSKEDYVSMAKENPEGFLSEFGFTVDQIIDLYLGNSNDSPQLEDSAEKQDPTAQELMVIKKELESLKKEKEMAAYQQTYNNELNKIYQMVVSDSNNRWDLIKETKNYNLVLETAANFYKANPSEPVNYEDVLTAVEENLEEYYGKIYKELSGIQKLQSKTATALTEPKNIKREMQKPHVVGHTLSTSYSADTPTPRGFTEEERFQRALNVLESEGD